MPKVTLNTDAQHSSMLRRFIVLTFVNKSVPMRLFVLAIAIALIGAMSGQGQPLAEPKLIVGCQCPLFEWGINLRETLDSCLYRGANVSGYRVVENDTIVDVKMPRLRIYLHINQTGYYKFAAEIDYENDPSAWARHDDAMLHLRQWYSRQLRYKIFDEQHVAKCDGRRQILHGISGSKNGYPGIFRYSIEIEQPK